MEPRPAIIISRLVSYLFHPVLVPSYLVLIILNLDYLYVFILPPQVKWLIFGMMLTATAAFPVLFVMIFVRRGFLSSVQMNNTDDRILPLMLTALIYYSLYLLFRNANLPEILNKLLFGVFIILIVAALTSIKFKISLHMLGAGGAAGALIGISLRYTIDLHYPVAAALIIAGIIGFSRLQLGAHKSREIYSGFLAGLILMSLQYYFF